MPCETQEQAGKISLRTSKVRSGGTRGKGDAEFAKYLRRSPDGKARFQNSEKLPVVYVKFSQDRLGGPAAPGAMLLTGWPIPSLAHRAWMRVGAGVHPVLGCGGLPSKPAAPARECGCLRTTTRTKSHADLFAGVAQVELAPLFPGELRRIGGRQRTVVLERQRLQLRHGGNFFDRCLRDAGLPDRKFL